MMMILGDALGTEEKRNSEKIGKKLHLKTDEVEEEGCSLIWKICDRRRAVCLTNRIDFDLIVGCPCVGLHSAVHAVPVLTMKTGFEPNLFEDCGGEA